MFVLPLARTVQSPAQRAVAPQLGRAFDRLIDESFDRYFGGAANGTRSPALDVSESDSAYTLAFDLPGVTRDQLVVSVEGRRVTVESIDAEPAAAAQPGDAPKAELPDAVTDTKPATRVLYRERSSTRYARTVSLPAEVDQGTSQAKFENGVLTLTLVKRVPTGATRLSIG